MMDDNTTRMWELNEGMGAEVDTSIMPLIKFLNKMGVTTVSSRKGDEVGHAQVRMVSPTHEALVDVLFRQIHPMIAHMEQSYVQITFQDGAWTGTVGVKKKDLDDLTHRVGCWLEMLHK
jgi:hypothetical protein